MFSYLDKFAVDGQAQQFAVEGALPWLKHTYPDRVKSIEERFNESLKINLEGADWDPSAEEVTGPDQAILEALGNSDINVSPPRRRDGAYRMDPEQVPTIIDAEALGEEQADDDISHMTSKASMSSQTARALVDSLEKVRKQNEQQAAVIQQQQNSLRDQMKALQQITQQMQPTNPQLNMSPPTTINTPEQSGQNNAVGRTG